MKKLQQQPMSPNPLLLTSQQKRKKRSIKMRMAKQRERVENRVKRRVRLRRKET